MNDVINIEYPKYLVNSLWVNGEVFKSEIKTNSLVKLYELGKVWSAVAAKVLCLSKIDFWGFAC